MKHTLHTALTALLAATLILPAPVAAQQAIPPGGMVIDGYPVACGPAWTILVGPELGDVAKADIGGNRIALNWPVFNAQPTLVKVFVYAHECGHIVGYANEDAADAFAVKLGRQQGWLNPQGLQSLCAATWMTPGDWTHFPGPLRCQRMIQHFWTY
jgi:hypothetical protein